MKPNPSCFTKQKLRFENEGERFWEEEDWWNPIYKPMLSAWCYSLYPCLSFVFSLCLCYLCTCFLFVSLPSFSLLLFFSFFFFLSYVLPLFIETPKELFPYFSLNWSDHGTVFVNFSSTIPYSMLSHEPLFSFLLFLFAPFAF